MDEDLDISQLSNKSFISSLGDDELIEFINKLSQKNKNNEILPPTNLSINSEEVSDQTTDISIPLAQPQPILISTPINSSGSQRVEEPDNVIFGDFASYFENKAREQQKQDEDYIEWEKKRIEVQGETSSKLSNIFKGCVIHVNGHTKPGITTLHKLIILNGGKFIHHLSSKGSVTHIIATRITPKKQIEFKNYKIVKPDWIIDSIAKGKLLNWIDYSIINVDYGQERLPFKRIDTEEEESNDTEEESEKVQELAAEEDLEQDDDNQEELSQLTQDNEKEINDNIDIAIDSKHPNFLKIFFSRSRLHHLSTWKSDLRSEFLKLAFDNINKSKKKVINSNKIILHVDFDCFFATASSLKYPDLDFENTPICVSHGGSKLNSTADISSCNYVCRKFGIKNGMWINSAKKLCPNLICLDYDFEIYEKISKMFYKILINLNSDSLFPVSIDEALLDITSLIDQNDLINSINEFCLNLRNKIKLETNCSVSCGVSSNVLLAKLSLKKAKPNGQFYLHENIQEFLNEINIRDLPGTGYSIESKLIEFLKPEDDIVKIKDLKSLELNVLEKLFGLKTSKKLFNYARGIDKTSIDISENPQEFLRKSVSIDINWGIRFDNINQIDEFLTNLSKELIEKLNKIGMLTSNLMLKILKRSEDAPIDPPKYLGCGKCDSFTKTSKLALPTNDFRILGTEARSMFRHIGCDPIELRGISLGANKLISKNDVDNQRKLPFNKISFDVFTDKHLNKKAEKENSENLEKLEKKTKDEKTEKITKSTQFEIPSDIESSILEELPSSIKNEIKLQKTKNEQDINSISNEIDLEVFNSLPRSIQEELKQEFKRRNIQILPQTPRSKKNSYLQQVFPINGNGSELEYVRIISPKKRKSPTKKNSPTKRISPRKETSISPTKYEKYNPKVLNELPSSIRKKIVEEWESYELINKTESSKLREANLIENQELNLNLLNSSLSIESNFYQINKCLKFQKKTRPKEILQLIESWILHTKIKGPNLKDLEIFYEFMDQLYDMNKVQYLLIVERMNLLINEENDESISNEWIEILDYINKH